MKAHTWKGIISGLITLAIGMYVCYPINKAPELSTSGAMIISLLTIFPLSILVALTVRYSYSAEKPIIYISIPFLSSLVGFCLFLLLGNSLPAMIGGLETGLIMIFNLFFFDFIGGWIIVGILYTIYVYGRRGREIPSKHKV